MMQDRVLRRVAFSIGIFMLFSLASGLGPSVGLAQQESPAARASGVVAPAVNPAPVPAPANPEPVVAPKIESAPNGQASAILPVPQVSAAPVPLQPASNSVPAAVKNIEPAMAGQAPAIPPVPQVNVAPVPVQSAVNPESGPKAGSSFAGSDAAPAAQLGLSGPTSGVNGSAAGVNNPAAGVNNPAAGSDVMIPVPEKRDEPAEKPGEPANPPASPPTQPGEAKIELLPPAAENSAKPANTPSDEKTPDQAQSATSSANSPSAAAEAESPEPAEPPVDPNAPIKVESHVDKLKATINDEITYSVRVEYEPDKVDVTIPEFGAQIPFFRINDAGQKNPETVGNKKIIEKWYKLQSDVIGSYIIPSISIPYTLKGADQEKTANKESADEKNASRTAKTTQIFVEIGEDSTSKEPLGDIRDIKPILVIQKSYGKIILGVVFGLIIMGGIIALVLSLVRRKKVEEEPPLPPHTAFYLEIEELLKEKLVEAKRYAEFFGRFSDIFRRYIEGRFFIPAVERTTEEIIPILAACAGIDRKFQESLQGLLEQSDLFKFAKHIPTPAQIQTALDKACDFVNATKIESPDSEYEEVYEDDDDRPEVAGRGEQ
jgi:hypothetical protein